MELEVLQALLAELTVLQEVHDIFGHIPAVHDEGVGRVDDLKRRRALDLSPLDPDHPVIRTRDQPRPERTQAPIAGDDAELKAHRQELARDASWIRPELERRRPQHLPEQS